jgi:copper resistance protein D
MDDATLAALRPAASALFDLSFAGMAGALATCALAGDAPPHDARCRRMFLVATLAALAAKLAWMALQAIAVTELPPLDALLASGGVIADTQFGRAWVVAMLALSTCAALAFAWRRRPAPLRWLALALAVVAAAHAGAGHAGANGLGWLVAVTALHALATGAWAGSVFAAAWVVPAPGAGDRRQRAARLSALATAALAVVVATGAACAWHGLGGSPAPLAPASGSSWGLMLDAKLVLVAVAVALGGFNRFAVMPSLPAAWPRFARVLRVESAVLLAVLVAAALLANGEPPAA